MAFSGSESDRKFRRSFGLKWREKIYTEIDLHRHIIRMHIIMLRTFQSIPIIARFSKAASGGACFFPKCHVYEVSEQKKIGRVVSEVVGQ